MTRVQYLRIAMNVLRPSRIASARDDLPEVLVDVRHKPAAAREAASSVFLGASGVLDDTVECEELMNGQLWRVLFVVGGTCL